VKAGAALEEAAGDGGLIQVRISSTERQACEMVKEAIQLAIQEALGHEAPGQPSPGATALAPQLPVNQ